MTRENFTCLLYPIQILLDHPWDIGLAFFSHRNIPQNEGKRSSLWGNFDFRDFPYFSEQKSIITLQFYNMVAPSKWILNILPERIVGLRMFCKGFPNQIECCCYKVIMIQDVLVKLEKFRDTMAQDTAFYILTFIFAFSR